MTNLAADMAAVTRFWNRDYVFKHFVTRLAQNFGFRTNAISTRGGVFGEGMFDRCVAMIVFPCRLDLSVYMEPELLFAVY